MIVSSPQSSSDGQPLIRPAEPRDAGSIIRMVTALAVVGVSVHSVIFSTWRGMPGVYVVDLYVDEAFRGAGLGVALLRAAAKSGEAEGCGYMMLDVDMDNSGAKAFYERLGYQHTGEFREFPVNAELWQPKVKDLKLARLLKLVHT